MMALLNGDILPQDQAQISPMDRGFLFGDGIYEVIPTYGGRMVGFDRHMQRLQEGLDAIAITNPHSAHEWFSALTGLLEANGAGDLGVYLHVSRGAAPTRSHKYPEGLTPTVFAFTFPIAAPNSGDAATAECFSVATGQDLRWQRCHIKSTALLGNVLHMMEGVTQGAEEILLFNGRNELTEAAACNVFVVAGDTVLTPALDNQKLPGITRNMLVDMMRDAGNWSLVEGVVTRADVSNADEIWLTSSTKEVSPVTQLDGVSIGNGKPGPVWVRAQELFDAHRFDY